MFTGFFEEEEDVDNDRIIEEKFWRDLCAFVKTCAENAPGVLWEVTKAITKVACVVAVLLAVDPSTHEGPGPSL